MGTSGPVDCEGWQKAPAGLRQQQQHMERQSRPCAGTQAQLGWPRESPTTDLLMQARGCQWAPPACPSWSACAHRPPTAGAQGSGTPHQAHWH